MANLIDPIVKKISIRCDVHDVVIPPLRIKNICVMAVKLSCEVIHARNGPLVSFTGMHKDISWVLHTFLNSENTSNGLLSLIKRTYK